ncbi:ABC aliphatic sulfonate transporter, inner membrane subunit [Candidatus Koribacter versatilis Ellin345]|uniref:ABC aliphatic sulfonate transporter, inner membrane subunit n=1 Tax=Koribacter versatilis (strain Ellin345) TaxID=204669 RepID=Q1ITG8_KORVE|nr:ABC transporter permease [Candidatus Koribacter versatilis]ABF39832.1 ABC aliphatic sulfonate transporter, inner membrane subunit [Candidatus Koribacter versatilis Ellin345]
MRKALQQIAFYSTLLVLWESVALLKLWPPYLFPTPLTVFESLRAGFSDHSFWIGITVSMKRVAIGYAISCLLGVGLGFLITYSRFLSETAGRLIVSLQSIPSICWLPVAILWFGLTEKAILFVVVMGSLLAITISVESGLRSIPKIYSLAGRNLGANGWKLMVHVLLPASLPYLISGLKQGWAFAWRSLISGEMIFVTLGLGQLLMMGRDLNDISQVFAVMLLIVALGWLVDTLFFRGLERAVQRRWGFATP